jgi:hypothetical protein
MDAENTFFPFLGKHALIELEGPEPFKPADIMLDLHDNVSGSDKRRDLRP